MKFLSLVGCVALAGALLLAARPANAIPAVGVTTDNSLIGFDTTDPTTLTSGPTAITGLGAGETVLGLDQRPANSLLYALTKDAANAGRLYSINRTTAAATLVGTLAADPADVTSPYTALSGTEFGLDFNPVVDRLRVVSDSGQNLRVNVNTGLVITDGDLNPGTPNIVANAYTNSFAGASSTTLYGIDVTTRSLYIQNPPNNGTLTLVGSGFPSDFISIAGFDIAPGTGGAFVTLTSNSFPSTSFLYQVDLSTGLTSLINLIGGGQRVRGLTLVTNPVAPSIASVTPVGATDQVGNSRTFSVTATDGNTAGDIKEMWLLINTRLNYGEGATLIYVPNAGSPTNGSLYLRQGDVFLPPITIGTGASSSAVLDNGAVRVVATDVTVAVSPEGNSLTLTIPATIRDGLIGQNTLFARVSDSTGSTDPASLPGDMGFVRFGNYTVTPQFGGANVAPTLSKLSPGATYTTLNGSGVAPGPQNFTFYAKDENGLGDIESVWFLAGKQLNWANSATIVYQPRTRRLFLRSDDGSSFLGGGRVGQAGTIENSQVKLDLSKVQVFIYPDGKSFGLRLPIQAKTGLLGQNKVWLRVQDNSGVTSSGGDAQGYVQSGTWNVIQGSNPLMAPKPSNGNS